MHERARPTGSRAACRIAECEDARDTRTVGWICNFTERNVGTTAAAALENSTELFLVFVYRINPLMLFPGRDAAVHPGRTGFRLIQNSSRISLRFRSLSSSEMSPWSRRLSSSRRRSAVSDSLAALTSQDSCSSKAPCDESCA